MISLLFTLGQYDFLLISDMPDAMAAARIGLVATGGGGIEGSITTQAFTTAEAKELFATAGKIAYKSPWRPKNSRQPYQTEPPGCRLDRVLSTTTTRTRPRPVLKDLATRSIRVWSGARPVLAQPLG